MHHDRVSVDSKLELEQILCMYICHMDASPSTHSLNLNILFRRAINLHLLGPLLAAGSPRHKDANATPIDYGTPAKQRQVCSADLSALYYWNLSCGLLGLPKDLSYAGSRPEQARSRRPWFIHGVAGGGARTPSEGCRQKTLMHSNHEHVQRPTVSSQQSKNESLQSEQFSRPGCDSLSPC